VSFSSNAIAQDAMAALNSRLAYDGRPLTISMATDKRDVLFPSLSEAQRQALQLDSVALYSVAGTYSLASSNSTFSLRV
jgi:hypothetical protein